MSSNLNSSELFKHLLPESEVELASKRGPADGGASGDPIVEAAQAYLRRSPTLSDARIWCEAAGEKIVLRGHVPTYSTRHAARVLAEAVCGSLKVENRLDVVPNPVD